MTTTFAIRTSRWEPTVQGATSHFDWKYVEVKPQPAGLVFCLPRGRFHLLPYAAIGRLLRATPSTTLPSGKSADA